MTQPEPNRDPDGYPGWLRCFSIVKNWQLLAFFILFIGVAIWLSVRIMRLEIETATKRLVSNSAGASRNLETQFDSLRDDFRVLVSTGAFEACADVSSGSNRNLASVKRFFARYQEMISCIEVQLLDGEFISLEIAPGNHLRMSERAQPLLLSGQGLPSKVTHEGSNLIIEELVPAGDSPLVKRVCVQINHNRFFGEQLASYLMGQSELWIWSIEDGDKPILLCNPMKMGCNSFEVDEEALHHIHRTLEQGLEGVKEHRILASGQRSVVSAYTPLLLGGERMGLVFSTDSKVHLKSLHRLAAFLGLIFLGSLVLMISWFAISSARIRESERGQAAARRRAEAADRAKSEFVAAMSHEIRTPLNGVLGYADLLMGSKLTASQWDQVEVIRNSGDHLLSILNDILDFSKISAGGMSLRSLEYSPLECAEDVIDMMSTAADGQGLELRLEVRGEIPSSVMGDAGRLRQVLYNLVGNGLKFTQEGSVSVTLEAFDQGDHWRLAFMVSDTGIGIPTGKREHIFAPFSQLDSSNTREYEGTGLGLAICRRLVEKMGGMINFDSEVGIGSKFYFWIMVGKVDDVRKMESQLLIGRSVMIIDGSSRCRESLSGRIRRMGALVVAAEDESEGIRLAEASGHLDLVMVHWVDGAGSGQRIHHYLKNKQSRPATMIALMERESDGHPSEELFKDWLVKPLRLAGLTWHLIQLINREDGIPKPGPAGTMRFLIVEDNLVNIGLMVALLEQRGGSITVAHNGLEALSLLKKEPFDLVFMDVEMPGLDGIEVTRRFREVEAASGGARVTIVGLSAHAFHEDRDLALEAGMDDYLTKPIAFTELDRVLTAFGGGKFY